jgi:hypothetical protein
MNRKAALVIKALGWVGVLVGWSTLPTVSGCIYLVGGCLSLVAIQVLLADKEVA